MKILHISGGGEMGGAKTHILSLLSRLSTPECRGGLEIKLISLSESNFTSEAAALGIDVQVIDTGNFLRGVRMLVRAIKKSDADIIHCHGPRANVFGIAARMAGRRGRVYVTTIHGDYRHDYLDSLRKRLTHGLLNTIALRFFDYYITVSSEMTDILISRRFSPGRIRTLFNGIDFTSCSPGYVSRCEYFTSIGADIVEDDVVFGMAGRFHPVKDIPTLLRGFACAYKTNKNIKLIIAGDGSESARLKDLALELGIEGGVFFVGWLEKTDDFYNAIDVNVLPSLSEGFPYVALEGARARRMLVSTRSGIKKEVLDDGYNGFFFNAGDHGELGCIMLKLAADRETIRLFGERLYESWSRRYGVGAMCKLQKEYYTGILGEQAAGNKRFGKS